MTGRCTTGKVPYRSGGEARESMKRQKAGRVKRGILPKSAYCCPHCGEWHLTSKSKGESRQRNRLRDAVKQRLAFVVIVKEHNTVSWLIANPVSWVELEIVNDATVFARFKVGRETRIITLRNE